MPPTYKSTSTPSTRTASTKPTHLSTTSLIQLPQHEAPKHHHPVNPPQLKSPSEPTMYPHFTPEEWAQQNPYAYSRGVSPPRNRHEEPRRGYRSADYRSVSPPYSTELRRRPCVNSDRGPRMHASLGDPYSFGQPGWGVNMPGGYWFGEDNEW